MTGTLRVFGPVPSRRLGKSLGINNIPPKICTYSCVYCQLGRSLKMIRSRQEFYDPQDLFLEIKEKIANAIHNHESIDFLTFVSDGEPTLDINLGKLISLLKPLGYKVAVITNSTLLHDPALRKELKKADWVSVKIDALDEKTWRKIDRPHKKLNLDSILDGIRAFSQEYNGQLMTETMLVQDLNDDITSIKKVADFICDINPSTAYLSIPTRPPAELWVNAPDEIVLNRAFHILQEAGIKTEYLIGYEGNEFAYTGNIEQDLLSITSVHPMREDAVMELLTKASCDFSLIEKMIQENKIVLTEYQQERYYIRKLPSKLK